MPSVAYSRYLYQPRPGVDAGPGLGIGLARSGATSARVVR